MAIDASQVTWDDEKIDPSKVKWDKEGTGSRALDVANAGATGYNQGLLRLAGLPVDTVANVLDLGKAAIGAPYIAATGKAPPAWLLPYDRKAVPGTGDYLIDQARKSQVGRHVLNAANPDYDGGYIQNAGASLAGGVMRPQTALQGVNQALIGVGSGTAGKFAAERTDNPALAVTASLLPLATQQAVTSAGLRAVRGGEAGRRQMEQRIQDLENAGVTNPTLGLASGSPLIGGIENLLQNTPGAVGVMRRARENSIAGLQGKTQEAANAASSNRGSLEAGQSIQTGLNRSFRDDFKARQQQLYDRMDQFIPGQTPVNVATTKQTIADLNADIPGAPNLSKQFKNSRIQSIGAAMDADTTGTLPAQMITVTGGGGLMNRPVVTPQNRVGIPGGSSTDTLPFEAVKKTRTLVGNEIADNSLMSDVPRSKWNPLYGALTEDLRGAAQQAGPGASKAFDRATDYTRAGIERMERVGPFADAKTPETAFRMYQRAAEDNLSTMRAVKKSLPEDARGEAAGTIVERLGRARPGAQDDIGAAWSPETFLTNWNRMTPATRQEMFSGFKNAGEVKTAVDNVARATAMMRDNSRLWANPSGTAANVAARGTLGAVGLGGAASLAGLLSPVVPLAAGGGLLSARMLADTLTSPSVVRGVASRQYLAPQRLGGQIGSLFSDGLLSYEPQQ